MNRYIRLVGILLVSAATRMPFVNVDPLYRIMHRNKTFHHFYGEVRREMYKMVLGLFVTSMSLSGVVVAPLVKRIGSKASAFVAHTIQMLAVYVFFFLDGVWPLCAASVALGVSFQLNSHSHMGLASLFPRASAMVVTSFAVCGDISTLVAIGLEHVSKVHGVRPTVIGYIGCIGAVSLLDLAVTPRVFAVTATTKNRTLTRYTRMSAREQLSSQPFWLLFVYFTFSFIRQTKFFAPNVRDMLHEFYPRQHVGFYVELYNWANALSFFPAIMLGLLAESLGSAEMVFIHALCGVGLVLLPFCPHIEVHWLGIALYSVNCYTFGVVNVFMAEYFGFDHIVLLSGIVSSTTGVMALVYDFTWAGVFAQVFNRSYKVPMFISGVLSIVSLTLPVTLLLTKPVKEPSYESLESRLDNIEMQLTDALEEIELPLLGAKDKSSSTWAPSDSQVSTA